jgi:zinc transporter ZupT
LVDTKTSAVQKLEKTKMHPILNAFIATTCAYVATAAGAALVFFTKNVNDNFMDFAFGTAAGIMTAASAFGLINPAIEMAEQTFFGEKFSWVPCTCGFVLAVLGIQLLSSLLKWYQEKYLTPKDRSGVVGVFMHNETDSPQDEEKLEDVENPQDEGVRDEIQLRDDEEKQMKESNDLLAKWHKAVLLVTAITIHNVPEGLAVGVAFAAAGSDDGFSSFGNALALAIGISFQNIPEGIAVAFPLRKQGMGRLKSWFWGQASAMVFPIGGVIGASISYFVGSLLPYMLGFAAGAMFYVIIHELLPEAFEKKNITLTTYGFLSGFLCMLCLDVTLG